MQSFCQDSINYPGIEDSFPLPEPDPVPDSIEVDIQLDEYATKVELNELHARLDSISKDVATTVESIKSLVEMKKVEKPVSMPMPGCECQCPTLDEIRQVVREELDRVTITVKNSVGVEKKVTMPISEPDAVVINELQPGDVVTAIDGIPVVPFTYNSTRYNAPVTQYRTSQFEMRVLNGRFGAVRSTTCRTVNGQTVCD